MEAQGSQESNERMKVTKEIVIDGKVVSALTLRELRDTALDTFYKILGDFRNLTEKGEIDFLLVEGDAACERIEEAWNEMFGHHIWYLMAIGEDIDSPEYDDDYMDEMDQAVRQ